MSAPDTNRPDAHALQLVEAAQRLVHDVKKQRDSKVLALSLDPSYGIAAMLTALDLLTDAVALLARGDAEA